MTLSGKAKLAGIIGWPVTHSLSPPSTVRPGWRRDTVSAFCSARLCAIASAPACFSEAIKASSSSSAGSQTNCTPAAVSRALRLMLPEARTNSPARGLIR